MIFQNLNLRSWSAMLTLCLTGAAFLAGGLGLAQPKVNSKKKGYRLILPVPFQDSDIQKLKQQIQRIVDREQQATRPVVVIEFKANVGSRDASKQDEPIGRGTEFERSLSLARWLIGPNGIRARTVAYLPQAVEGHAVLVALACEEIAMTPSAAIGRAGIDEPQVDPLIVRGYLDIAARRGSFPPAAVTAMLNAEAGLFRVELKGERTDFVVQEQLEKLREAGSLLSETQISVPNQIANFLGREARASHWVTHIVDDEPKLDEVLGIDEWSSLKLRLSDGPIKPAVIDIHGAVGTANVNRWLRVLDEAVNKDESNLIVFQIHSPGGSLHESLRLAHFIADLNREKVMTVAWIDGQARGDAALIGMATDRLFMSPQAILGGPGEATIEPADVLRHFDDWNELAAACERKPVEFYGLLSPNMTLKEHLHKNGAVELADPEIIAARKDFNDWKPGKAVAFPLGMRAEEAIERHWIEGISPNLLDLANELGVDKLPEPRRVTPMEQWIRRLADQTWLSALLLTLALSLIANEMSTPGLGIAGFMAMLCLLLFFWMRFLDGTVEWLEILLCVGGMFALGLELFVIPGLGIFGFGGAIMLIAGIILAGQTFIVPANEYQWSRMAISTGQIAVAIVGLLGTLYLLRNQLENLPFFRMLKLDPPPVAMTAEKESLDRLVGKQGLITARCAPIGTALIEDKFYEVHALNELIEPNSTIVVSEVRGQVIHVRTV
jgi:membrane-bound ClpP family serine protease